MNGTSSLISAGVTSEAGSMPHAFADAMRRRSSSMRSSVRAISMPPHSVKTSISRYWRELSDVSAVISLEWSTRKMKFEAWPVEPPGFGSGPLSSSTMSVQPSRARWWARLLPTMPQPITTARARAGRPLSLIAPLSWDGADGLLEGIHSGGPPRPRGVSHPSRIASSSSRCSCTWLPPSAVSSIRSLSFTTALGAPEQRDQLADAVVGLVGQ